MSRHRFDPVSFVPGVFFAVIGIAALAGGADLDGWQLDWLFPVALILAGVAVLTSSLGRSRPGTATVDHDHDHDDGEVGGAPPTDADDRDA